MSIFADFLRAAVTVGLSLVVTIQPALGQRIPVPIRSCIRDENPSPVARSSKTHVIIQGYQFDYPSNYRLMLENDGSLFLTTEAIYQYLRCATSRWVPEEAYPNGILIQWRRQEELSHLFYSSMVESRGVGNEVISGRNATFYLTGGIHSILYVTIPSRGGYVVISTNVYENNQVIMEEAFLRVIRSIVVP